MCGRFGLYTSIQILKALFQAGEPPITPPRYNIAPSQPLLVVCLAPESEEREWRQLRWGLIPSWAKDPSIGNRMINAKVETLFEKPAFRSAARKQRCLVPADCFYEWKTVEGRKQPYLISFKEGPLAFAGIWERWQGPNQDVIESCAIITMDANPSVAEIHTRMPLILRPDDFERWLNPSVQGDDLAPLVANANKIETIIHPVSRRVNDVRNDDAGMIDPVELNPPPEQNLF